VPTFDNAHPLFALVITPGLFLDDITRHICTPRRGGGSRPSYGESI